MRMAEFAYVYNTLYGICNYVHYADGYGYYQIVSGTGGFSVFLSCYF
jgi:hypothetical protein